jgi:prefoldin subunit 5
MTPDQELSYMKNQAEYLTSSLEDIQKRISELENKSE